jgi:hypothetical protein
VMVARERDQGRVAFHSTTRGYSVVPAALGSAQIGGLVAPARGTSNPSRRPRRLARATRRTSARRKRRALSVSN